MKKATSLSTIFMVLLSLVSTAHAGEIVVDAWDWVPNAAVQAIGDDCGVDLRLNSVHADDPNLFIATVGAVNEDAAIECLREGPGSLAFQSVEKNTWVALDLPSSPVRWEGVADLAANPTLTPDDPLYQYQWNLKQVGAETAWAKSSGGKDVVVAIIDTGVALTTGLVPRGRGLRVKRGKDLIGVSEADHYDFVDDHEVPWDCHGHGTHVAGTVAQATNNKYGVAGLAPAVKIMALRVLSCEGFGQVSDIADAIYFAADNGAHVINMSLGGPLPSDAMAQAVKYANNKGVVVVAAAGNGGSRAPSFPAAQPEVISVAATQFDKTTTFYSQWGWVDIAAPGGNTKVDQNGDGRPDGVMQETVVEGNLERHDFMLYMGTSMASPHVAAAAALIIGENPKLSVDDVKKALYKGAEKPTQASWSPNDLKERYGAGLLRVDQSLKVAAEISAEASSEVSAKSWGGRLALIIKAHLYSLVAIVLLAFYSDRSGIRLRARGAGTPLVLTGILGASLGAFGLGFGALIVAIAMFVMSWGIRECRLISLSMCVGLVGGFAAAGSFILAIGAMLSVLAIATLCHEA